MLTFLFLPPMSAFGEPAELVTTHGRDFVFDGKSFSFVGMNIRGLCHYGHGDPLPYTNSGHIDENLNGVAAMGGKVIRLFAAVNNATNQEAVDRLKVVLDKMQPLGLKAIVCFTDVYTTAFHPQGDDGYYLMQPSGWTLLDDTWFASGYTINYLPFVQLAVTQLKDHSAVFAWELGNEITDLKNPTNIVSFTANVAAAIKAIDPHHMVTTGFLSIDHTQIGEALGKQLYEDPNIDFITVHSYTGEDHNANRAVASRVAKPIILEEYGWHKDSGDRVANTTSEMAKWFRDRGVRGYMNWGYQAQAYDIGDGDGFFGIDRYSHTDYTEMVALYSSKAAELTAAATTLPERLEPEGENVSGQITAWNADSIFNSSFGGDKVYDGVVSEGSKWTSQGTAPPHWLALDLGRVCSVDGITVRMAGDADENVGYNFKAYEIQTGTSLSGPWTTKTAVSNPAQFSVVHTVFESPESIRFLRIYVTDTGIDYYARLPEVEVYELTSAVRKGWMLY